MPIEYSNNILYYGDFSNFFGHQRIPLANVAHILFNTSDITIYIRDAIVRYSGYEDAAGICATVKISIPNYEPHDTPLVKVHKQKQFAQLKQFVLDWEKQFAPAPPTADLLAVPAPPPPEVAMTVCFTDGQFLRHKGTCPDTWIATYSTERNKLVCNGTEYASLTAFATAHCAAHRITHNPDGWDECECQLQGVWIKCADIRLTHTVPTTQ